MTNARLEDFGVMKTRSARERLEEYRRQCKGQERGLQAAYFLKIIHDDPEVAKLIRFKRVDKHDNR